MAELYYGIAVIVCVTVGTALACVGKPESRITLIGGLFWLLALLIALVAFFATACDYYRC